MAGDMIVTTAPGDSILVSNRYRGALPAYSLPEIDPDVTMRLAAEHDRFWVLGSAAPSAADEWLARLGYLALQEGAGDRRLSLYALAPASLIHLGSPTAFEDGITLRDMALARAGDTLMVRLTWSADSTPSRSYKVFVHALDATGAVIAQSDAVPAGWTRPTDTWAAGEQVEDRHGLLLPAGNPVAALRVGLYALDDGTPLPLKGGSAHLEIGTGTN